MLVNKNIAIFVLSSFNLPENINGFLSGVHSVTHVGYNTIVAARFNSMDEELEDMEKARYAFERLMQSEESSFAVEFEEQVVSDDIDPPMKKEDYVPILTESCRRRHEVEMDLLTSLATSDDAIEKLVDFWVEERDQESANTLKEMQNSCSPGREKEEKFLMDTINKYGYHYVEPISRLALLYYANGRYAESDHWCKVALAVKPWHFEVVQTRIMNAVGLEEKLQARTLALESLPPLEESERRHQWVEQALTDANDAMGRAQQAQEAAMEKLQSKRKTQVTSNYGTMLSDDEWQ